MKKTPDDHPDYFLTRTVEELTPENDPESWAAFQRFIAKWQTKSPGQNFAPLDPSPSGTVINTTDETEPSERYA